MDEQLAQARPDLLRGMIKTFADALMGAEADSICGAEYGERSDERVNKRAMVTGGVLDPSRRNPAKQARGHRRGERSS